MTVQSAKAGLAKWDSAAIADVRNIEVTESSDVKVYGSSSTACLKKRVAGMKDKTFSFEVYAADPAELTFGEGDTGYLDLESATGDSLFSASAVIDEISWSAAVEEGDLVVATVTGGQA